MNKLQISIIILFLTAYGCNNAQTDSKSDNSRLSNNDNHYKDSNSVKSDSKNNQSNSLIKLEENDRFDFIIDTIYSEAVSYIPTTCLSGDTIFLSSGYRKLSMIYDNKESLLFNFDIGIWKINSSKDYWIISEGDQPEYMTTTHIYHKETGIFSKQIDSLQVISTIENSNLCLINNVLADDVLVERYCYAILDIETLDTIRKFSFENNASVYESQIFLKNNLYNHVFIYDVENRQLADFNTLEKYNSFGIYDEYYFGYGQYSIIFYYDGNHAIEIDFEHPLFAPNARYYDNKVCIYGWVTDNDYYHLIEYRLGKTESDN